MVEGTAVLACSRLENEAFGGNSPGPRGRGHLRVVSKVPTPGRLVQPGGM